MTVVLMVLAPRACWRGADSLWKVELPLQRSLLTCPRSHHSISPRAPQVASVIGPDRWVPSPCIVRMLCRQEKQTRKIMQQFGGSRRLWMTSLPSMIQTKVFVVRGERVRRGPSTRVAAPKSESREIYKVVRRNRWGGEYEECFIVVPEVLTRPLLTDWGKVRVGGGCESGYCPVTSTAGVCEGHR